MIIGNIVFLINEPHPQKTPGGCAPSLGFSVLPSYGRTVLLMPYTQIFSQFCRFMQRMRPDCRPPKEKADRLTFYETVCRGFYSIVSNEIT
ncbi:MAG: hypothetical protein IJC98_02805 [Clostridia bacterium]|nr:hypothetical protein [Clostridia bacterium]